MIIVIDYGLGNIRSVFTKISQTGESVKVSHAISDIESADKLVLPGVGSFDAGISNLNALNLIPVIKRKVLKEKIPILGICLGLQLFTNRSEEGNLPGLGMIDADTKKFHFVDAIPLNIPHMGWNTINIEKNSPLLSGIENNSRFYFVHSYHTCCNNKEDIVASTRYGYEFPSIIQKENIFGVQFHPEKSHKQGMQLIKNFIQI